MSQHFLRAADKLKIVVYFDDLKNKIDLLVEIYISDNQHDKARVDEINKAREEWIKEADKCQAYNLAELEENENKDELIADEQLFKRFCFLVYSCLDLRTTGCFTWRFISTNVYLRPGQLECFQELLKFTSSGKEKWNALLRNKKQTVESLNKIFVDVEIYEQVSEYF
jgi:hypothetical protein